MVLLPFPAWLARDIAGLRVALCLLAACMAAPAAAVDVQPVKFAWRAGQSAEFVAGAASGELTGLLAKPATAPAAFVVFLHGCAGLKLEAVGHWVEFFVKRGVGVLLVDSLGPRGVSEACGEGSADWARRRSDDAAAAIAWLREQAFAKPDRIALMGQSQGATATLLAAHDKAAASRFLVGAIALYPGCKGPAHAKLQYGRPVVVMVGTEDTWTPAEACSELKAVQRDGSALEVNIYPGAPHSFDNPGVYRKAMNKHLVGEHAASRDKARERVGQFADQWLR